MTALQFASVNYYFLEQIVRSLILSWMEALLFQVMANHYPFYPAGELFAQAPVKEYPGIAVETVSDSSRYFVLRIQDDNGEDVTLRCFFLYSIILYYIW